MRGKQPVGNAADRSGWAMSPEL